MESNASTEAARLRLAVNRLHRLLRSNANEGITPSQISMLASVERLENPSLGDLAAIERIQPPSVTKIVRNLEKAGLLQCAIDPDDRRCTRASITSLGRKELAAIRLRKTEFLEQRLAILAPEERRKVDEVCAFLERVLDCE